MRDDRNLGDAMMFANKAHRLLQLLACRLGLSERRFIFRRPSHFRVGIRSAKAMKIQAPDIKSSIHKFVAPRATVEAVRDGQSGRESSAMNEKNPFHFVR